MIFVIYYLLKFIDKLYLYIERWYIEIVMKGKFLNNIIIYMYVKSCLWFDGL